MTQFDGLRKFLDRGDDGIEEFRASAFNILTSPQVANAFDLNQEKPKLREQYGQHRWGQSCLLARRLAEAGAAVINIDATATNDTTKHFSWDDHAGAFHIDYAQRERLPQMDQALTALINDLYDRNLTDDVLVIACGEFGRTPMAQSNKGAAGRDHHMNSMSYFMCGGGIKGGVTYGETDDFGYKPTVKSSHLRDMHATMLHLLGVNHSKLTYRFQGLDNRLTGVEEAHIIKDILV